MKIGLYARVSSPGQEERQSIQNQLFDMKRIAEAWRHEVYGEYLDEAVSGTVPFEQRPGGAQLVKDAQAKRFAAVWIWSVDRLGRSLFETVDAFRLLTDLGLAINFVSQGINTAEPTGSLLFGILASFASYERQLIR